MSKLVSKAAGKGVSRKMSPTQVWGAPVALALLSAIGLLAALVSDGFGDVIAWATLAVPVVITGWYSRN